MASFPKQHNGTFKGLKPFQQTKKSWSAVLSGGSHINSSVTSALSTNQPQGGHETLTSSAASPPLVDHFNHKVARPYLTGSIANSVLIDITQVLSRQKEFIVTLTVYCESNIHLWSVSKHMRRDNGRVYAEIVVYTPDPIDMPAVYNLLDSLFESARLSFTVAQSMIEPITCEDLCDTFSRALTTFSPGMDGLLHQLVHLMITSSPVCREITLATFNNALSHFDLPLTASISYCCALNPCILMYIQRLLLDVCLTLILLLPAEIPNNLLPVIYILLLASQENIAMLYFNVILSHSFHYHLFYVPVMKHTFSKRAFRRHNNRTMLLHNIFWMKNVFTTSKPKNLKVSMQIKPSQNISYKKHSSHPTLSLFRNFSLSFNPSLNQALIRALIRALKVGRSCTEFCGDYDSVIGWIVGRMVVEK